jgi:hypothetical protein
MLLTTSVLLTWVLAILSSILTTVFKFVSSILVECSDRLDSCIEMFRAESSVTGTFAKLFRVDFHCSVISGVGVLGWKGCCDGLVDGGCGG